MESSFTRSRFLLLAAAAQMATTAGANAQGISGVQLPESLKRSLVLSGGGALGAYEAGVVQALVNRSGVREGQPLPQYGVVTGTSIGALNAYLVATAQWSKLAELWSSISAQNVVRLKPQYAKIGYETSGIGSRIAQAVSLGVGAGTSVLGTYDGEYLQSWLEAYFDFSRPVVTPIVWAVTNLTRKRPEYFYLMPPGFDPERLRIGLESVRLSIGSIIPVREADRSILVKQLRASAAVPVAFDPVLLPGPRGETDQYVDGGLTANTPIGVARALSSAIDAVLLSPTFDRQTFHNIFDVTSGSFDTMQRGLMYGAVREAVVETTLFRAIRYMPDAEFATIARASGRDPALIKALANLLYDTKYFVLRPEKTLPATMLGFDDSSAIRETYQQGVRDGTAGFKPFDYLQALQGTRPS
jgi:predicted acylesterase/phospholipase RssA